MCRNNFGNGLLQLGVVLFILTFESFKRVNPKGEKVSEEGLKISPKKCEMKKNKKCYIMILAELLSSRPWDPMTDCVQYEKSFIVQTQTVHTVPSPCSHNTPLASSLPGLSSHILDKSNNHLPSDDSYSSENNITG